MTQDEIRRIENYALSRPLREIDDRDMLAFLASLIQGHDHLREKLMGESDGRRRREKLDAMRPHLRFVAKTCEDYEIAELARACGVQPYYDEREAVSKIWMPPSFVHEVH